MPPVAVPDPLPRSRRGIVRVVAFQPLIHIEEVDLLRPQQSCECLALHSSFILTCLWWMDGVVKFVSLGAAFLDDRVEVRPWTRGCIWCEPEPQHNGATRGYFVAVLNARLGS